MVFSKTTGAISDLMGSIEEQVLGKSPASGNSPSFVMESAIAKRNVWPLFGPKMSVLILKLINQ